MRGAHRAKGGAGRHRGVTLVELMVALTVLAVLLGVGVPSFARMMAANRMASRTNELVGALNLARMEAVRRGDFVTLRTGGSGGDFSSGWRLFVDAEADGTQDASATLREMTGLTGTTAMKRVTRSGTPGAYSYADSSAADRDYIVFNARGANQGGAAAFFRICDPGQTAVKGRVVQVSPVGRITLDSTAETC